MNFSENKPSFTAVAWCLLVCGLLGICLLAGCGQEQSDATSTGKQEIPDPPFLQPPRVDLAKLLERPKLIVFIIIDTLRADYVGAYGCKKGLTKHLDNLAVASYMFKRAVAPSSWTRASIASMFTSCYPGSIGVKGRDDMMAEDLLTLAELLKVRAGFHCIGISTNGNAGRAVGFAQGFDTFKTPTLRDGYPDDFKVEIAEGVTLSALKHLEEWKAGKAKDKPCFLFLHYIDPHDPYLPHPDLMDTPEPPGRFNGSRMELKAMDKLPLVELTDDDKARIEYLYSGEIKYCDKWIGKLLAGIYNLDPELEKKTLVVVTADHGEGLWNHKLRAHGVDLHEEQIHVPLIIRFPGMEVGEGKKIDHPVSLVDIAPTILTACGVPKPAQFQGHDLSPLIRGGNRGPAYDYVYSELDLDHRNFESIAQGRRKIIRNRSLPAYVSETFQYYDLGTDPREQQDLSSSPGTTWRGTLKKALKKWGDAVQSDVNLTQKIQYGNMDEETLENLKALGYIGGSPKKK